MYQKSDPVCYIQPVCPHVFQMYLPYILRYFFPCRHIFLFFLSVKNYFPLFQTFQNPVFHSIFHCKKLKNHYFLCFQVSPFLQKLHNCQHDFLPRCNLFLLQFLANYLFHSQFHYLYFRISRHEFQN